MADSWSLRRGHASVSTLLAGIACARGTGSGVLLGLAIVAVVTGCAWWTRQPAGDSSPANNAAAAEQHENAPGQTAGRCDRHAQALAAALQLQQLRQRKIIFESTV